MAAVVRVKRRINEEPLNAFILNCKKRKVDDEASAVRGNLLESIDEVSTILKFAGTVESQDENIGSQIVKLSKDDAKQLALKSRKPNITEKTRKEMRQSIHDNRFKVVNCFRTIHQECNDGSNVVGESMPREITVVDIERQTEIKTEMHGSETTSELLNEQQQQHISSSSFQAQTSSSNNLQQQQQQNLNDYFVYDLYLPEANDQQNMNVDYNDTTYLSVRPFDDLVYEDRCDNDDLSMDESEDSNAENYWKNDYPDEESICDSDIERAINNDIERERDLSSDDEDLYDEEGYINFYECDDDDTNRYGSAYSKYKAKIMGRKRRDSDDDDDYD